MTCIDCGCYVPEDKLKPCTALYKSSYPDGVPICDNCCKICNDTPAMGGVKKACEYLKTRRSHDA